MATTRNNRRNRRWAALAVVLFLVGGAASVQAGQVWRRRAETQGAERFAATTTDIAANLTTTLRRNMDLVSLVGARLGRQPDMAQDDFVGWLEAADLRRRFPTVSVFGFAGVHDRTGAEEALAELGRRFGVVIDASQMPPSSIYCIVRVVWVSDPSLMKVDPDNVGAALNSCQPDTLSHEAAERAIESGRPALTNSLNLGTKALTFFSPVYRDASTPATPEARRDALVGIVGGQFKARSIIAGALGKRIDLRVSVAVVDGAGEEVPVGAVGPRRQDLDLHRTQTIDADVPWIVRISASLADFDGSGPTEATALTAAGILSSALGVLLLWSLASARVRALRLVDERTADLQRSENVFRTLSASAPVGICRATADGDVVYANDALLRLLDCSYEEVAGQGWFAQLGGGQGDFLLDGGSSQEVCQTSTGRWFRVHVGMLAEGGFVASVIDVTDHRLATERLRIQARHDALTGLPNRLQFLESLTDAGERLGDGAQLAVLFIDLDRFKQVNDAYGHAAGDQLLAQAGQRLRHGLREQDMVARLGGDEFAVLMPDVTGLVEVVAVIDRLEAALGSPFEVVGTEASVGASIGVVLVDGLDEDAESILRDADMAMYRAKQSTGRYEIYEPGLRHTTITRIETERALRRALTEGEIETWFQPVHRLADGVVTGAEALVRWRHPVRGVLLPAEFLPVAESTGLIVAIGDQVLRAAVEAAARRPDLTISVNASSRQLSDSALFRDPTGLLDQCGVQPGHLCIEVVESHLVDDDIRAVLQGLRNQGVAVAVDDFGTGYNSLAYLRNLPVDAIKIDRSFVNGLGQEPADLIIVTKLVELAHALDLEVVAEGVERHEQEALLRAAGCDYGQGFLWSPAVPLAELLPVAPPTFWQSDRAENGAI